MAYYDEITMLRLGLGRWAPDYPAGPAPGRAEPARGTRQPEARQDAPERKVESPSDPD
ncbi:hypothetical protein [Aquicoccus porphyridii]|uniref:hypothetical protein n=1 Tax=Aquicoccus porphyridii TaxID=1852029 RepID=UPI00273E6ABC|nr:hypothetical protein [Aquicoccus porphyridii]